MTAARSVGLHRGRLLGVAALAAAVSLALCVGGASELVAHLAPALTLFAFLAAGHYPGERTLCRFLARTGRARLRPARRSWCPSLARVVVRVTSLLAEHLATRPPPAGPVGAR